MFCTWALLGHVFLAPCPPPIPPPDAEAISLQRGVWRTWRPDDRAPLPVPDRDCFDRGAGDRRDLAGGAAGCDGAVRL